MLQKKELFATRFKLLDLVELLSDTVEPGPSPWGGIVPKGAVGTIVEELIDDYYLVEFGRETGEEPAILTLPARSLVPRGDAPAR